ncbi:MAG: putative toxin-antitoxin system toxin component, PIN family [Solirubrobacterales bacterium]
MRIFLDANILFSAAKSAGAIRRLLELLRGAGHECWVDGFVIAEARRNLELKAPSSLMVLDQLLPSLRVAAIQVRDPELDRELPLVEKDRPILAAAIQLHCDALVTGDRTHFGELYGRSIRGVTIHSPRSLAEELLGSG